MKKEIIRQYKDAYKYVEDLSGKSIINIIKTYAMIINIYEEAFIKYKISESKFYVLLLLSESSDGIALSSIGEALLVTKANITGLLNRMEKEKLVEKRVNKDDKRSVKAYITSRGSEILNLIKKEHFNLSKKIMQNISDEEKEKVNKILEDLQENIIKDFCY